MEWQELTSKNRPPVGLHRVMFYVDKLDVILLGFYVQDDEYFSDEGDLSRIYYHHEVSHWMVVEKPKW